MTDNVENSGSIEQVDVVASELIRDPEVRKHAPGTEEYNAAVKNFAEKKTSEAAPDASEGTSGKKKSGLERRFSELTGERDNYKNRAAELEARLAQLEANRTEREVEPEVKAEPTPDQYSAIDTEFTKAKPSLDDYDTLADYQEAIVDWKLEKKEFEAELKVKIAEHQKSQETLVSTWDAREKDAKARNDGYDVLVTPDFAEKFAKSVATQDAMRYMLDSDYGPDLLYHLANDDDERAAFAKMTSVKQVAYLAKLDSKMEASTSKVAEKTTTSKAPAPSKPLPKGKTTTQPKDITSGINQFSDYLAWRNQNRKK